MHQLVKIKSDCSIEFTNKALEAYLLEHGIQHEYFAARTLKQNEVSERKIKL